MVRVGPTAKVSDWLLSVAETLPLEHRAPPPYTLGEAVAETGAYARATDEKHWKASHVVANRASLRREVEAQSSHLGPRLAAFLHPLIDEFRDDADQNALPAATARFTEAWCSREAIAAAFQDLCGEAQSPTATSRKLRTLSAVIAAQVGPASQGAFSLLNQAADVLVDPDERAARKTGRLVGEALTEGRRVELAQEILTGRALEGRVTVWTAYYQATLTSMRTDMGPITFLRADWALPNAFDHVHDFPEREELRAIRADVPWLDEAKAAASDPNNRLVIIRVDLGHRQLAGAAEEARRQIDAVVSVAVEAGGVSWRSTEASATLLDGVPHITSMGLVLREPQGLEDDYGIGATGTVLASVADQLGVALTRGLMPDHLIEALGALREARMTDHRDVLFHGARPVSLRVATALEDHALELIASVIGVSSVKLAQTLQRQESLRRFDSIVVSELWAPLGAPLREQSDRQTLEQQIVTYSRGQRRFSIAAAVALRNEVLALPLTQLQRADYEHALEVCRTPKSERQLLDEVLAESEVHRRRHRRVRNAINHGLPLHASTLSSVRAYASTTSTAALHLALTWLKTGRTGSSLLQQIDDAWTKRQDRISNGETLLEEETRSSCSKDQTEPRTDRSNSAHERG